MEEMLISSSLAEEPSVSLESCILPGRLTELSGHPDTEIPHARTTTAVLLLRAAQQEGETAAWVQPRGGPLYPPDLAEHGVDLDALVVVHVPPEGRSPPSHRLCQAAEILLRSGAFGLVVLDLCARTPPPGRHAWQGRLLGFARQHHSRVILLTEKPAASGSLGPRVSLRVETHREREGRGRFVLHHRIVKNKLGGPRSPTSHHVRGPWGIL